MSTEVITMLFALIRSAINGTPMSEIEKEKFSEDMLPELASISRKHDITHLIAAGLEKNSLLAKGNQYSEQLAKEKLMAVYRYVRLNHELTTVCESLESGEIAFIPLKGSVLRKYYKEPWMRTSCDIDILVHEEDVDKAVDYLIEKCGYTCGDKGSHDISLFTPSGNHIELHYTLIEDGRTNRAVDVLGKIWEVVVRRDGHKYWHELPDEMFYFYHIAHMVKHFEIGGCGVRSFIDLWILDSLEGIEQCKRDELLDQGELLQFTKVARRLSKVWMENLDHDTLSRQMENYILRGGVYGNDANRVMVQQQKKGGRFVYMISRIFLPYDVIKFQFPVLGKYRLLTPVMEVCRWLKLLFGGKARRVAWEMKFNKNISSSDAAETKEFLENIGL